MYYGMLKRTPNSKWLNVSLWLSNILTAQYSPLKIKYFTANVQPKPHDPHTSIRQSIYFRALATLPNVELIKGRFKKKSVTFQVNKDLKICGNVPEEKGTDVNIGVHLVNDAHLNAFDTAILVSNDSDIAEAVRIVRRDLKKEIWVINPCIDTPPCQELIQHASQFRVVREGAIRSSQFNPTLTDSVGSFTKPPTW